MRVLSDGRRVFTRIEQSILVGEADLKRICYSVCSVCCRRQLGLRETTRDVHFEFGADADLAAHEVSNG